jgi:hypothetical protein
MAETVPATELNAAFSSPDATPIQWSQARVELERELRCTGFRPFDLTAARMSRRYEESGSKGRCTSAPDQTNEKPRTCRETVTVSSPPDRAPSMVLIS